VTAAFTAGTDPNLGYSYNIPTADDCRNNTQSNTTYGWRPNHYAYCQMMIVPWKYSITNGTIETQGTLRVTVVGQGAFAGDTTNRNGGDGRVVTFTLYVDQITVTFGALPAGAELSFNFTCNADPAGSCNTTSGAVTMPFMNWEGNSASFQFTSPDGVGATPIPQHWVAFAYGSFTWTAAIGGPGFNPAIVNQQAAKVRFDGPGSVDMSPARQTGATFQPVDAGDNQVVDTLNLAYNGSYGPSNISYAMAAHHYYVALNYPNSTYPLTGNKTIPTTYTRLADDAIATAGRNQVVRPLCRTIWGTDYATRYGQPLECDEFPFASSYQGAPLVNGRPDGSRISVCPIPAADNGQAGAAYKAFLLQERIFDGGGTGDTAIDWYKVAITNVPTPAPTAAQALPCPTPDPNAPGVGILVINVTGGGQFLNVWDTYNDQLGPLGNPLSNWASVTGGQQQLFSGGGIYWSSGTTTHEVHGAIYADYSGLGGAATSPLGFPASDEQAAPGGGRESLFAGSNCGSVSGSAILWTSATGAGEMQGCIYQAYLSTYGGSSGSLGFPASNERPMSTGKENYMSGTSCGSSSGSALYWNGAVHAVYGCIFQQYKQLGEANSGLGFPVDEEHDIPGGRAQDFQHGSISYVNGVAQVDNWVTGHAAHAGNDYPYETVGQFDHQNEGIDAWAEYYGQCDSFAAWKVYENLAGSAAQLPNVPVPAVGWRPSNASVSPVNQNTWFNADNWDVMWKAQGKTPDTIPAPGSIAYWPNATTDPQDAHPTDSAHGIGGFGHVGYVTDVYPDGSVTIEMYNLRLNGEYSTIHMAYGQPATDTSYNQGGYTVPWPKYFIHVADGPAPGASSPAEPGVVGTVSWGYPSQVKVIGPGSPSGEFSLGNVWYLQSGHGETGAEEYTHDNGAAAVSTATWTPSGLAASTCYRIDALVPNNYSDNPVAVYTVTDTNRTNYAAVNENNYTNDWAELGVYETNSSGGIAVKLDDRGTTGLYVAADAMRFWRQTSCNGYGDIAPIMEPSSFSSGWTPDSGHGFFGDMLYSGTSGSATVTGNTVTYSPPSLLPGTCYEVQAYVPDNYSDNNAAIYHVTDTFFGNLYPQVNENAFTSQFTDLGGFATSSSGSLPVTLQSNGPAGGYVAADALAFTPDPGCNGATGSGLGVPYATDQIGPGSPPLDFFTLSPWYTQMGHGLTGHELWTHDNGSTADSTARWNEWGTASACYNIQAFIPDNYANNPTAHYTVSTDNGVTNVTLNQAKLTGWSTLATHIQAGSDGIITIILDDTGPAGDYTAADAMQIDPVSC